MFGGKRLVQNQLLTLNKDEILFFHSASHALKNKKVHDLLVNEMGKRSIKHAIFDKKLDKV